MRYTHSNLPETQGQQPARFDRAEVDTGSATYHAEPGAPAVDLILRGLGGAHLLLELLPDQADNLTCKLLEVTHRDPSAELVDLAAEVLKAAGWHESVDGALNPPEPPVFGFTVQVSGADEAVATRALLKRLIDAGDRDRFTVLVAGEQVWPVPQ